MLARAESKALAFVGGVALLLKPAAAAAALGAFWGNLGAFFGVTSLVGFAIAPEVSQIPTTEAAIVALAVGVLYALKRGIRLARTYWASYKENLNS